MLAMIAMKNPIELTAENVRRERENVLSHLRIYSKKDIKNIASRGQYKGYRDLPHTNNNSKTETYFQVKAFIDDDDWRDVPFYLEGGKNFNEKKVEIEITFRPVDPCVCGVKNHEEHKDTLIIKLSPDAGIDIIFWVKKPGVAFTIEKRKLSFRFADMEGRKDLPEAYETVLFEAIKGDPLLFTTSKEVESTWRFITPIVENWSEVPLRIYKPDEKLPEEIL
jgi:glucose-6-phosphate 1-dehydrogenase